MKYVSDIHIELDRDWLEEKEEYWNNDRKVISLKNVPVSKLRDLKFIIEYDELPDNNHQCTCHTHVGVCGMNFAASG